MRGLMKALGTLVPVIIALNIGGGVIGGIWAIVAGDWWAVGYAFLGMVVSHFVISLLLVPALALGAISVGAMERRAFAAGRLIFAVSSLYTAALTAAWALYVTVV